MFNRKLMKHVEKMPKDMKINIGSFLYFPYEGFDFKMKSNMNEILNGIKNYKNSKLLILFHIDNFIFPVQRLLYRWLCLDRNISNLKFVENEHNINFDKDNDIEQFKNIINLLTNYQMSQFHKFCIFS